MAGTAVVVIAPSGLLEDVTIVAPPTATADIYIGACRGIGAFYSCNDGGCCPDGYACGLGTGCKSNETLTSIQPPVPCPGHNGYYACPTALGDGCCPGGFVCDKAVDCRLTLKLSFSTNVFTTTESSGSVPVTTRTVTSLSIIGNGKTAVDRIATATGDNGPITQTEIITVTHSHGGTPPVKTGRSGENPNVEPNTNRQGLTTGHIIGMAVGAVCFLAIIGIAVYLVLRRRRRRNGASGIEDAADGSVAFLRAELEAKGTQLNTQLGKPQNKPDVSELPVFDIPHELGGPEQVRLVYELESEPRVSGRGS